MASLELVETETAFAEELSSFYPINYFDVVHCNNALDHSLEPVRSIEEMLLVVKLGGRIALRHLRNVAELERYVGLHQWNFDSEGEDFIIWNMDSQVNVTRLFAPYADIREDGLIGEMPPGWIAISIRKTAQVPVDLTSRWRDRLRELLPAVMMAFQDQNQRSAIASQQRTMGGAKPVA